MSPSGAASRAPTSSPPRPPGSFSDGAIFELVPLELLRPHEQIEQDVLEEVLADLRKEGGGLREPLLVARQEYVVLNGHHRLAALVQMGARKAPAWVVDYHSELIQVERWPGSPYPGAITKAEVLAHAKAGHLFPPKTTKHTVWHDLPVRRTALAELL